MVFPVAVIVNVPVVANVIPVLLAHQSCTSHEVVTVHEILDAAIIFGVVNVHVAEISPVIPFIIVYAL